jgi:hypothetical protein
MMMRRILPAALALLGLVATAAPAAAATSSAPAQPAAPAVRFCGLTWGDGSIEFGPQIQGHIKAARYVQRRCFDRLALDLGSRTPDPGLHARYTRHCIQDASGQIKPMRGGAIITLTVFAPDAAGFPANKANLLQVPAAPSVRPFRQVRSAGNFEGISTVCIGVKWRLPFRAKILHPAVNDGRSTIVLDVAEFWNQ